MCQCCEGLFTCPETTATSGLTGVRAESLLNLEGRHGGINEYGNLVRSDYRPKDRRLPPVIASGGGGGQIIGFDGTMPGYFKRRIVYAI